MAATKKRTTKKPPEKTAAPSIVVFRLDEVPFARRFLAAFGCEELAKAPCFVVAQRDKARYAPIWKVPEPKLDPRVEKLGMWLVGELGQAIQVDPGLFAPDVRGKGTQYGFHLGFDLASLRRALKELGFEVIGLARARPEQRDKESAPKKMPAVLALDDEPEQWTDAQKKAFVTELRAGRFPSLRRTHSDEVLFRDDRVAILEELAGKDRARVRTAVLEDVVGEFCKSTEVVGYLGCVTCPGPASSRPWSSRR